MKSSTPYHFCVLRIISLSIAALCTSLSIAQAQPIEDECQNTSDGNSFAGIINLDLDDPFEPIWQVCGTGSTTVSPFTVICPLGSPGSPGTDIYGPIPCDSLPRDLSAFCRSNSLLGNDPTTGAGNCMDKLWHQTCPGSLACKAPDCLRCPRNTSRVCKAFANRKGEFTSALPQFTGALTPNGAGMCSVKCTLTSGAPTFTMTGNCICETGCLPC